MPRPNFFIMGAPKCGTTSMYQYLSTHPAVFVTERKEPHYFATDLPARRQVTTEADYLALFADARAEHSAIGEASTWYLFSREAAERIRHFCSEARLVVFFRNPVDFAQSLHDQFAYDEGKPPNFLDAWQDHSGELLKYGSFGTQLQRLLRVFPPEQVLVVLFDDLVTNPRAEYRRVLGHLGLEDDARESFVAHNARKLHRSTRLADFIKHTPRPAADLWFAFKRVAGLEQVGLLKWLSRVNTKVTPRSAIDRESRERVRAMFADEIDLLANIIGRDLSHWV